MAAFPAAHKTFIGFIFLEIPEKREIPPAA
jgi:hypothetical protein